MAILGKERWDVGELRSHLGIVSPDLLAACTTEATGRDIVLSGFFSSTRIFPHHDPWPELVARAEAALARLGLSHLADRAVTRDVVRGGEAHASSRARSSTLRRRCSSTSRRTPSTSARRCSSGRRCASSRARVGVLLVTHHVSEIIPEIERVILLREGRVVADGPKERILTEDRLGALFGARVNIARDGEYFHIH